MFLQVQKIIGFVPALLQLVMSEQLDMPVRQAGLSAVFCSCFLFSGDPFLLNSMSNKSH